MTGSFEISCSPSFLRVKPPLPFQPRLIEFRWVCLTSNASALIIRRLWAFPKTLLRVEIGPVVSSPNSYLPVRCSFELVKFQSSIAESRASSLRACFDERFTERNRSIPIKGKEMWQRNARTDKGGETVCEFMTAARSLSRDLYCCIKFLPRAKLFQRCDREAIDALMALRTTVQYSWRSLRGPRERGEEETPTGDEIQQRRGVTMASGRQVVPLLLSSHPFPRCSSHRFPIVRGLAYRCSIIFISLLLLQFRWIRRLRWTDARSRSLERANDELKGNTTSSGRELRGGERGDRFAKEGRGEERRKTGRRKRMKRKKGIVRRRNWETGESVLFSAGSWLAPSGNL